MKKIIILIAACLMTIPALSQNTTRIGANHKFDVGAFLAISPVKAGPDWNGAAIMDYNFASHNGRLNINFGCMDTSVFTPDFSCNYQYLFGQENGLFYFYPTAGIYTEVYTKFKIGAQAGAGLEFQINDIWAFYAEGVYQMLFLNGGSMRPRFSIGVRIGL